MNVSSLYSRFGYWAVVDKLVKKARALHKYAQPSTPPRRQPENRKIINIAQRGGKSV